MKTLTTLLGLTAIVTSSLVLGACGGDSLDQDDINTSADAIEGTSDTTAMFALVSDSAGSMMAPETAAAASLAGARASLSPAGCVVAVQQGATVNYTFTNCTGPRGLVLLNGTASATFSNRTANGWTVTLTGDLTANQAQLRPNAVAQVSYSGDTRTANVTVMGSGVGRRGVAYTNRGSYTSTWDGNCFGLNGSMTSSAGDRSLTLNVSNFRRCRGECPQAGGAIAFSNADGDSISVSYSGGANAQVTGVRGNERTVRLFCGG